MGSRALADTDCSYKSVCISHFNLNTTPKGSFSGYQRHGLGCGSISAVAFFPKGQVTLFKLLSVSGLQSLNLQNETPKPFRLINPWHIYHKSSLIHGRHDKSILAVFPTCCILLDSHYLSIGNRD